MRERYIDQLPQPQLGTWSITQACALTGNKTGDLFVLRPVLNPLSLTSQGYTYSKQHAGYEFMAIALLTLFCTATTVNLLLQL